MLIIAGSSGCLLRTTRRTPACAFVQLICLLVVAASCSSADSLTLTNGDKITCTIEKLDKGELTVKIPYADDSEVTFAWNLVALVKSDAKLKLRLDDGSERTARLQPATEPGQFVLGDSAEPLALSRIASIETQEAESSWTDNLSSDTDFNLGYTGTDDLRTIFFNTQNFYWGSKWESALLGTWNVNRNGGQPVSLNQLQGQVNVNRYLTPRFFLFPWGAGLHVGEAANGHGSIWQIGGGGGWSFIRNESNHLQVMGGLVALTEQATVFVTNAGSQRSSASLDQRAPAILIASRWQKTSEVGPTWMFQAIYYHPTAGDLRSQLGLQATFSVPIAGPVSADVNVQDYTSAFTTGLLSVKALSVSSGVGLHF